MIQCLPFGVGLPIQIGFFVSFHPIIAPVIIGIGVFGLMYWLVSDNVLPLIFTESLPLSVEILTTAPIGIGTILVTYGTTAELDSFWFFALVISVMGKIIQGGITIYGLRRLSYYAQQAKDKAERKLSDNNRNNGPDQGIPISVILRTKLYVLTVHMGTRIFVLLSFVGTSILIVHTMFRLPIALAIDWSLIVGTTTLVTLLMSSRHVRNDIGIPAVVGIVYCVAGTEVYEYPTGVLPNDYVPVVNQLFQTANNTFGLGLIGFNLTPLETIVLFLNPIAYLIGILLALVLWRWAPRPTRTEFAARYRDI